MRTVTDMLAEIPALAEEVHNTRGTRPVSDDGPRTRSVPGSRCLADLDRMMALSGANDHDGLGVLSTWVRAIIDEMDEAGEPYEWPDDNVASACEWLTGALRWSVGRGYEASLHADISTLWETLRRICRVTDVKGLRCLTLGCPGHMAERDGMLECEHGHRHDGLRKWRHHPSMLDKDAAEALNVKVGAIRVWKTRGQIGWDEAKTTRAASYVWPWDVVRMRYPDLAEAYEQAERERHAEGKVA